MRSVVLKTVVESLAKVVNNQQKLIHLLIRENLTGMGRANVESILEASQHELDLVKMCVSCLNHPRPDIAFKTLRSLQESSKEKSTD